MSAGPCRQVSFRIRGAKISCRQVREVPIGGHESGGILVVLLGLFAYIDSRVPTGELPSKATRKLARI